MNYLLELSRLRQRRIPVVGYGYVGKRLSHRGVHRREYDPLRDASGDQALTIKSDET